jgi:hypothetical protein
MNVFHTRRRRQAPFPCFENLFKVEALLEALLQVSATLGRLCIFTMATSTPKSMRFSNRYKAVQLFFLTALWQASGACVTHQAEADAANGLTLDLETQQRVGVHTAELAESEYRPEFIAYGVVQNLQPLLELRNRYFAALAARSASAAHLQFAQKNRSRLKELYDGKAVSQRRLQEQEVQWQANRAQEEVDRYQIGAIRHSVELQWGKTLADCALSEKSPLLLKPHYQLLLVTLPPDRSLPEEVKTIHIEPSGNRAQALEARLVSAAAQTNGMFQGETYFFSSEAQALRIGMRVTAWIAQQQNGWHGVIIPASAVVWHLGQAFVYVQNSEDHFLRRAIDTGTPTGNGYFLRNTLEPGQKLVVTGAQMLLSEEFRAQIPSEDDD